MENWAPGPTLQDDMQHCLGPDETKVLQQIQSEWTISSSALPHLRSY